MPNTTIILDPAAQQVADLTAKPPFLYQLGVEGARKVFDDIQAEATAMSRILCQSRFVVISRCFSATGLRT